MLQVKGVWTHIYRPNSSRSPRLFHRTHTFGSELNIKSRCSQCRYPVFASTHLLICIAFCEPLLRNVPVHLKLHCNAWETPSLGRPTYMSGTMISRGTWPVGGRPGLMEATLSDVTESSWEGFSSDKNCSPKISARFLLRRSIRLVDCCSKCFQELSFNHFLTSKLTAEREIVSGALPCGDHHRIVVGPSSHQMIGKYALMVVDPKLSLLFSEYMNM